MGGVEEGSSKKPLALDSSILLPDSDDPPSELIVTGREGRNPASMDSDQGAFSEFEGMPDRKLEESIAGMSWTLQTVGRNLPDKGAKLKGRISRFREEKERRNRHREKEDVDGSVRITSSGSPDSNGPCDSPREETASSPKQSSFTKLFSKALDEKNDRRVAAVDKAPFSLNNGEQCRKKSKRKLSPAGRRKPSPSSRWVSLDREQHSWSGDQRGRDCLPSTSFYGGVFSRLRAERKDDFHVRPFNDSKPKKVQTVVLDDEEECQLVDPAEQGGEIPECMKETKIYYPSRDYPGSIEIYSTELDCLKPEGYLTSTIMNFYILHLQLQPSVPSRGTSDYLFFNTYFYKKLQEAASFKEKMNDASFVKFRRWWKGVNIFQKAYILIPIHEEVHWSLAIICIPDKEDGSGPILLHLDSLQYHRSKSIFGNIRRFLLEEWNHLKQEVPPTHLPIAEEVWGDLPRHILEKKIMVPQQKNDYDCGPFVLYFMERFIKEAPERIKKKDLAMFGKQWFRPEDASSLRVKIRKLLLKELEKAVGDQDTPDSSPHSEREPSKCLETIE